MRHKLKHASTPPTPPEKGLHTCIWDRGGDKRWQSFASLVGKPVLLLMQEMQHVPPPKSVVGCLVHAYARTHYSPTTINLTVLLYYNGIHLITASHCIRPQEIKKSGHYVIDQADCRLISSCTWDKLTGVILRAIKEELK